MDNLKLKKEYVLGESNYHPIQYMKKQIIIGNTFNNDLNHIVSWRNRLNGKYKTTAPISILKNGDIYFHYDPKYHSEFMGVKHIDKYSIPIVLENQGWLTKNLQNDTFLTWIGDIYNGGDNIIEKKWRKHIYWDPYTDKQIDSLNEVCDYLCDKFEIPKTTLNHNTYVSSAENLEGVLYKANFSKYYTDVNPAFNFERFKNNL